MVQQDNEQVLLWLYHSAVQLCSYHHRSLQTPFLYTTDTVIRTIAAEIAAEHAAAISGNQKQLTVLLDAAEA